MIAATSVRFKSMADGSLQIVLAIEPKDAVDAVRLFAQPGTSAVLARLTQEAAQSNAREETLKGGPLAKSAGMLCDNPKFQEWADVNDSSAAAAYVRDMCGLTSRAELDHDTHAAQRFHWMMAEFNKWREA